MTDFTLSKMRDSTGIALDSAAARQVLDADGYLLVRDLLEPGRVHAAAEAITTRLSGAGWTHLPSTGDASTSTPSVRTAVDLHRDRPLFERCIAEESIHLVGRDPALLDLVGRLLGDRPLLVHPNLAIRAVPPGRVSDPDVTPPHQDLVGMQGTPKTIIAWCPLLPSPVETGPLEISVSSHLTGPRPAITRPGARVLCCATHGYDDRWAAADLWPGDVLIFTSLTVHRARANRSQTVRLSVDMRYQPSEEPICEASLRSPLGGPWELIRANWSDPTLRRGPDLSSTPIVPFDPDFARRISAASSK